MSSRWQQAWVDAEPLLERWLHHWNTPNLKRRVLRVNQLDAELLDEELVQMLKEPLTKALGLVNVALRSKLEPELALIIKLTLYKFSVWDIGATYGAKLQDLRYRCEKIEKGNLAPSGLSRNTLAVHTFSTVLLPYFHARLRSHALSNAWPDTPSTDKRRKAWNLLSNLESVHSVAALLNFIVFLWNGRYRTLADRLLGLRLMPSRRFTNRQVSYEFMNRQMVWHAFTEFLLLFLPVFSSRAFRRTYNQVASRIRDISWSSILPYTSARGSQTSSKSSLQKGRFFSLPENQCAICVENASFGLSSLSGTAGSTALNHFGTYLESAAHIPSTSKEKTGGPRNDDDVPPTYPITTPYRASCGHVYCYVCIFEKLLRAVDDGDDGWTCLRCLEMIHSCDRVNAIYEDETTRTSEGWTSELEEEHASFESDLDVSLDSEHSDL